MTPVLIAALLGILEGLTEFLPVSSTGHLILAGDLLGFQVPSAHVFEIVIQLGAILAICVLFSGRITSVLRDLPRSVAARRVVTLLLLGFLPAAVIGSLFHRFITEKLFSPYVVCASLFLGGIAILVIERMRPSPRYFAIEEFTPGTALKIGFAQCIAMIPGVSRSGATILGGVLFRVDRPAAAEYSFLLAIPTMIGASALELYKNREALEPGAGMLIAVGFVTAFLSALLVVRWFVAFIARHGFSVFGWYRIVLAVVMAALLFGGVVGTSQGAGNGGTAGISKGPTPSVSTEGGETSRP